MGYTGEEGRDAKGSLKARIQADLKRNLKEKRLNHTYSVVAEARRLAERYGEDPDKAELAALFHDLCRNLSPGAMNLYIRHFGLPNTFIDNPNLAHGKIAAELMKRQYGVRDQELLDAVAYHTTGRAGMSTLEKIVFLADAIEPGRNYPTVEETRALAEIDLDRACINALERTIEYIENTGRYLDPDTLRAREDLKEKLNL